jgi:hypothetical protein
MNVLPEDEVQDLINDPKHRHPYDLARAVEAAVLERMAEKEAQE